MTENRACAFTGHRTIKQEHKRALPSLVRRGISYAYENGCRSFFAGGAIGFDTIAAREVIAFKLSHPDVRLILLLPCEEQAAGWHEQMRRMYEFVLNAADEVRYVSDTYTKTCMKKRNMALAEEADIVIAYVDRQRSGAAQTVRMAEELGKIVYNLYPAMEAQNAALERRFDGQ